MMPPHFDQRGNHIKINMVLQPKGNTVQRDNQIMTYEEAGSRGTKRSAYMNAKTLCQGTFPTQNQQANDERVEHIDESREPCPGFQEKTRIHNDVEFSGASDELAQKLKRRRSISPSDQDDDREQATSDERRDASEERRDESPTVSHHKTSSHVSHLTVQTGYDDDSIESMDKESVDVQSIISQHLRGPTSPHDTVGVASAHRTMNLSTSKDGRREKQLNISLITARDVNNKMDAALSMMEMVAMSREEDPKDLALPKDSRGNIGRSTTDETIHDASTKLDAALSMMEEYQRVDADRKIVSMMQVQKDQEEDYKQLRMPSNIDWETGECDKTPWVGQVGINDDIFEDEPLEYAEAGRASKQQHRTLFNKERLPNISLDGLVVHKRLLLTGCGFLLVACVLGWAASFVHTKKTAMCTLCYDGSTPSDLHASMVGGQTCQDFRASVESLPALDSQCLQGQSLAWLMCDCPSLPPFPKKPSCTLCGEGVLLKGSACNQLNIFMAHISDPDYCDALKSSVSKAGCSCPEQD